MDILHNLDAEKALIGIALNDSAAAQEVAALPDDLFTAHHFIAAHHAIAQLISEGKQVDLLTVIAETAKEVLEPEQMLIDAMAAGFAPTMARQYIAMLDECKQRRDIVNAARKVIEHAQDPGVSAQTMREGMSEALQGGGVEDDGSVTASDAVLALVDQTDHPLPRIMTGIADLDDIVHGFAPGQLIILGARPAVGKSALGIAISKYVAEHSGGVLYISMEMGATEVMSRMLAAEAKVDVTRIDTGRMTDDEKIRCGGRYGAVAALPVWVNVRAQTPLQVRRCASRMMRSKEGLKLIVIDYLQLMRSGGKANSRYEEVSTISRDLKRLAMDLNVPILAMCQLNRTSEMSVGGKAQKREPTMAEARDSGSIEQDANVFMILHQPDEPTQQGTDAWELYHAFASAGLSWLRVKVEKNRQGRTGAVNVGFDKPHMRFVCITEG